MYKFTFLFLLNLGLVTVFAQSTVTNLEMSQSTISQMIVHKVDMTPLNVSPGSSGANVTWDFIPYTDPTAITNLNSQCPGAQYCEQYPTANRITHVDDDNAYFILGTNDFHTIGSYNNVSGDKVIYSDIEKNYQFPITYGQTFTDTFAYALQGSADVTTGTVTSEVDGYGTLLSPYGTIAGVLRIKKIRNYVVPNFVPGIPLNMQEENYEWIDNYGRIWLVYSIATGSAPALGINYTLKSIVYTDSHTFLATNEANKLNNISIFPNPVNDEININCKEKIHGINIVNMEGKKIKQVHPITEKIDVRELSKGMYFLKITTEKGTYLEKFIKK